MSNTVKNYARIEGGQVVELFATDGDITTMFHPELRWLACDRADVAPGWTWSQQDGFGPPAPRSPSAEDVRADRLSLLVQADLAINRLEDTGQDAGAWRKYRQALRDVPAQKGFPKSVKWPTPPA